MFFTFSVFPMQLSQNFDTDTCAHTSTNTIFMTKREQIIKFLYWIKNYEKYINGSYLGFIKKSFPKFNNGLLPIFYDGLFVNFSSCTIHLCVLLFDKYCSRTGLEVSINNTQTDFNTNIDLTPIALVCLILASKIEESKNESYDTIIECCNYIHDIYYFLSIETSILKCMNYKLYYKTISQYLSVYEYRNADDKLFADMMEFIVLLNHDYQIISSRFMAEKIFYFTNILNKLEEKILSVIINDPICKYLYIHLVNCSKMPELNIYSSVKFDYVTEILIPHINFLINKTKTANNKSKTTSSKSKTTNSKSKTTFDKSIILPIYINISDLNSSFDFDIDNKYKKSTKKQRTRAKIFFKTSMIYFAKNIKLDTTKKTTRKDKTVYFFTKDEISEDKIIELLGKGTFGTVSKILINDEIMALKKITTRNVNYGINIEFLREINSLRYLKHPNVVTMTGIYFNLTCQIMYIGMELMEYTLYKYVQLSEKKMPDSIKINLILQLLEGLTYMHKNGIMHRDLSINNILISKNKILKIADMGSSRFFRHKKYATNFSKEICTLWFRPIELLIHEPPYSYNIDIWSCACNIVFILSNKHPFSNNSFPHTTYSSEMIKIIKENINIPSDSGIKISIPEIEADDKSQPKVVYDLCQHEFQTSNKYPKLTGLQEIYITYPKYYSILIRMFDYPIEKRISCWRALKMFKKTCKSS